VDQWGKTTRAKVVHGVGGSFDVLAGVTRRAPAWCQDHGLEWLYRAWQEPVRLGRRYLTTNLWFMGLVARELMRRRARTAAARSAAARPTAPSQAVPPQAGPPHAGPSHAEARPWGNITQPADAGRTADPERTTTGGERI
jgi:Glycosyl transferase WecG/TagA/CpsF family